MMGSTESAGAHIPVLSSIPESLTGKCRKNSIPEKQLYLSAINHLEAYCHSGNLRGISAPQPDLPTTQEPLFYGPAIACKRKFFMATICCLIGGFGLSDRHRVHTKYPVKAKHPSPDDHAGA